MKKKITEEMQVHKDWYKEAGKQTLETLPDFISHLINDYEHDYGTICHALTAGAIGTMWAMNKEPQGGITGFQSGCIMWEFIRHWNREDNKTGLRLVDYDNMLFPQYADDFEKTISENTWEAIQEQAKNKLKEKDGVHPNVKKHWESIVNGLVPFNYKVISK